MPNMVGTLPNTLCPSKWDLCLEMLSFFFFSLKNIYLDGGSDSAAFIQGSTTFSDLKSSKLLLILRGLVVEAKKKV